MHASLLDMPDDLDFAATAAPAVASAAVTLYSENCDKCGGSGRYYRVSRLGVACFKCGGSGKLEFKTSPDYRKRARATAAARKQRAADSEAAAKAAKAQAWRDANPEAWAWISSRAERFDFATQMQCAVTKWGGLTEGQLAAVLRCIETDKAREAEKAKAAETAPKVDSQALEAAFSKAKASGLKWPKINLGGLVVSPASATSANAGALYVKQDGQYLGKVMGGRFLKVRECDDDQAERVAELIADPAGAAKAYGLRTGECCVCSRELTDKDSIEAGIGPICAKRFGF